MLMKKLIFIAALVLAVISSYGQTLKKGNFLGFHVMTINLNQNVTMDQYIDFWKNKVLPEYEKNLKCKCYLVKGIRGESKDCFGGIMVWKSEAGRDQFFNKEGGTNDLGKVAMAKLKPVLDELKKLGTYTTKYTDWVIQ